MAAKTQTLQWWNILRVNFLENQASKLQLHEAVWYALIEAWLHKVFMLMEGDILVKITPKGNKTVDHSMYVCMYIY